MAEHTDITLRKAAEDEVRRLAFYDPLTHLSNRRLLSDRLQHAISQARRNSGQMALMYVDLDKFKPVNDRYGHDIGDALLGLVAQRLLACVRQSDTVARVGGDEFVVLLMDIKHEQDALLVAEKIHAELRRPFSLPGSVQVGISSSTGIALYPLHGQTEAELSHSADVAMYAAKGAGRDQFMMYNPDMDRPAGRTQEPE
ncbi:cyclic di-GMP phosphodiesterase Gmr [mine drainage metagenome]|uniref:Cyclic di-GMP phosphodiesterase Gmr n=1 Tax=mine drainage metagenome TaxID=410659 RepID=A0A1J5PDH5_9ZZZZ